MDGPSISPRQLYTHLGTAAAPLVIDVRRAEAFGADDSMIIGALRRVPEDVAAWGAKLPKGRDVAVYCVHGKEVSQGVAKTLNEAGIGDAIVRAYDINDAALNRLATIVRGADTSRPGLTPQCEGLLAISYGLSANFPDDHEMLKHGLVERFQNSNHNGTFSKDPHLWAKLKAPYHQFHGIGRLVMYDALYTWCRQQAGKV